MSGRTVLICDLSEGRLHKQLCGIRKLLILSCTAHRIKQQWRTCAIRYAPSRTDLSGLLAVDELVVHEQAAGR